MVWLWIVLGAVLMVALLLVVGLLWAKAERVAVARARVRAEQRYADARVQAVVQDTIQQMLDAARRRP